MPNRNPVFVRIEKLKEVLGEDAFAAVNAALLRDEIKDVISITPEQVEMAKQFFNSETLEGTRNEKGGHGLARRSAFAQVTLKWLRADKRRTQVFGEYLTSMNDLATNDGLICPICQIGGWRTDTSLNAHKMWHSRDRAPKVCPVCGIESGSLSTHITSMAKTDAAHGAYRAEHTKETKEE